MRDGGDVVEDSPPGIVVMPTALGGVEAFPVFSRSRPTPIDRLQGFISLHCRDPRHPSKGSVGVEEVGGV
jgi:hypothetical protein